MNQRNNPAIAEARTRAQTMHRDALEFLLFSLKDSARDPEFYKTHLLSVLFQDYLEGWIGTQTLVKEGMLRPARREARFILEMSVKMAFIQQSASDLSLHEKLDRYEEMLNSPSISKMRSVRLPLLSGGSHADFFEECGRLYGESSKYVHLSAAQIQDRMQQLDKGRTVGFESADDINELNSFLERTYANAIVLIMHSIADWVVGDWLVDRNAIVSGWYFLKSKYIADIDRQFDYKQERSQDLVRILGERTQNIAF
jgi:hypothetical protein